MEKRMTGRIWKLGDDIDTDIIMPTQFLALESVEAMKAYAFSPLRPELPGLISPGDIIVAGRNFGCGSSREQAPEVLAALGVSCIVARSFARIFYRNAFNNGLLLFESDLADACEEGDTVTVDLCRHAIELKGRLLPVAPIPGALLAMVEAGGLVRYMKGRNDEGFATRPSAQETRWPSTGSMTLVEKIVAGRTGREAVAAGEMVFVDADHVMIHDLFAPFVIEKFREMGFSKVWNPERIAFVYDHLVPASFTEDSRHHRIADVFAAEQGIRKVHRSDGVCHQLMPEMGYARPGDIVFGTDSHTTTYGAVGAFSTGIGYTEMAAILGTGELWIKVPPTLRFQIDGALSPGVSSKDVILRIIGDISADGATYRAMEFGGSTIDAMSVASRMTMANMAVEAGAKAGIMAADEKTLVFAGLPAGTVNFLRPDEDAAYEKVFRYDAATFEPIVACPSNVDRVRTVKEMEGTPIDQAFLGSCTNGRLEDLATAARIVKGRKVAPYVRFIVTPASRKVYADAVREGYMTTLIEAGAIVTHPACGLCCGRSSGIVADGQRVIATNNRNFLGRMGSPGSEVFLASPATVAASALEGRIVDPRRHV